VNLEIGSAFVSGAVDIQHLNVLPAALYFGGDAQ
jgi:hypothetical protein